MTTKRSTEELLFESAMELISIYPLHQVSVQDISRHCKVSTRAFYNHFRDKNDLIEKSYVYLLESYFSPDFHCAYNRKDLHSWLLHTATQIYLHSDYFYHIAQYTGQNNFRVSIFNPFYQLFIRFFVQCKGISLSHEQEMALSLFLHGMIGSVELSLLEQKIYPPEKIVSYFELGLPAVLKELL